MLKKRNYRYWLTKMHEKRTLKTRKNLLFEKDSCKDGTSKMCKPAISGASVRILKGDFFSSYDVSGRRDSAMAKSLALLAGKSKNGHKFNGVAS